MSNQVILWAAIILPWLTLLFLKKEDVKRYMPVALFGALATTIVGEVSLALNWWNVKDAIFPFYHMPPFTYGVFPVGIIWIFKLTYNRFLLFMITNVVFDFVLSFPLSNWLMSRGILELINITGFQLLLMNIVNAVVLYGYQMWQDGVLISPEPTGYSPRLQPAAAKRLPQDEDETDLTGPRES